MGTGKGGDTITSGLEGAWTANPSASPLAACPVAAAAASPSAAHHLLVLSLLLLFLLLSLLLFLSMCCEVFLVVACSHSDNTISLIQINLFIQPELVC